MHIAILINTSWNIYNFRSGLIHALKKDGNQVTAIAPRDDYSEKLIGLGCDYVEVSMQQKGSNPIEDWKLKARITKVLRKVKPDILLLYTIKPNIYGTLAAAQLGIPVINNISGLGTVFIRSGITSRIAKLLYKKALKKSELVFFQNDDDRRDFTRAKLLDIDKTELLPGSGVDLEKFAPTHQKVEDNFRFLMVSRVIYDKGIVELIEAIKILKGRGLNITCGLVGFIEDGNNLGVPRQTVDSWVEEGLIEYYGVLEDIRELLSSSNAVVLPSYREGTPKSLLEAIAMAKPIITTDVPGCREVVEDQVNGFLCKVRSSSDLADKMERMINLSADELSKMGIQSRKLAETRFDEKIVIDRYKKAIKRLVEK